MPVLVCFALKEEAAPFQKLAAGQRNVDVLIVGIGRRNADHAVRRFLGDREAEAVFTCGFAGGLNPELQLGEVVLEQPPLKETPPHPLAATWHQRLQAAGARPARFHCADRIAITAAEKRALRLATGADAVEMESAAIHAVCRERGLPCLTVRVISDPADTDLPLDFNALAKPDQSLDLGKLAWALARSPGKVKDLLRLQRHTRQAARQLAAVLAQVIFP